MSSDLLSPYKGARDFYPEDMRVQKWMFHAWRRVCEKYGYEEYSAPILEPVDLFRLKGSEEIINEQTYSFHDRGEREVMLRTEMTPSVSRMVAQKRQELSYPLRWYSIPNLWRYERPQRGRSREFWQLNVDVFGIEGSEAEIEMIQIADDLLQAFHAKRSDYEIRLNSRKVVDAFLREHCGLSEKTAAQVVRLTDKKLKMEPKIFAGAMLEVVGDQKITDAVLAFLNVKKLKDIPKELLAHYSVVQLNKVIDSCKELGITNIIFDITLMRGFDYYTDIVFEVFDADPDNNRSMYGGGRYDGLVGMFGVDPIATVGFGMGDITFMNFLESHGLLKSIKPRTEAALIVREGANPAQVRSIAVELREMGMNVAVDYSGRKVPKQFKSAVKSGIPYAIFVGDKEIAENSYILKDLESGKEHTHSLQRIVSMVKDSRYN